MEGLDLSNSARSRTEYSLGERIIEIYRQQVGRKPDRVSCQFFEDKVIAVVERSIALSERLLVAKGQRSLTETVLKARDRETRSQLVRAIEVATAAKVLDLLCDTNLETERTGILAILDRRANTELPTGDRAGKPRPN